MTNSSQNMPKIQFLEEKVGYDKAENYDERGP